MAVQQERLNSQQRGFLVEASRREWISARMFEGAGKAGRDGNFSSRPITLSSAQAVMRRLARRGLLVQDERNPAIFRITESGREAVA